MAHYGPTRNWVTPKTEYIRRQVQVWAERDQIPPEAMILSSFTKTAAAVLRGRVPVPDRNATTIHALAFHALGMPTLAEVNPLARAWNEGPAASHPGWQIEGASEIETGPGEAKPGSVIAVWNRYRAGLRTNTSLPTRQDVAPFIAAWESFKDEHTAMDFTDLLEEVLHQQVRLPYGIEVLVVDEAQDLSPLLFAVADFWGADCRHYVQAGDPAQVLYQWLGASPDPLLTPLPADRQRLLGQSYRLPQRVHALAERWLQHHSPPLCEGRSYKPTEDAGLVEWRRDLSPTTGEELAEALISEAQVQPVAALAHCAYQLQGIIAALREAGEPFWNPYRPTEATWNPLGETRHGTSTMKRLRALLQPEWGKEDIELWSELLMKPAFTEVGRAALLSRERLTVNELHHHLQPQVAEAVAKQDIAALLPLAYKRFQKPLSYAAKVGAERLWETPKISVGTVHSWKGGESPTVYYLPHASPAGGREAASVAGYDSLVRQRYVAVTRAKQVLVLCTGVPASGAHVPVEHEFRALEEEA